MVTRGSQTLVDISETPRFVTCLMYIDDGDVSRNYDDHIPATVKKADGTKVTIPLLFMDTIDDLYKNVEALEDYVEDKKEEEKRQKEIKEAESRGYERGYDEGYQRGRIDK